MTNFFPSSYQQTYAASAGQVPYSYNAGLTTPSQATGNTAFNSAAGVQSNPNYNSSVYGAMPFDMATTFNQGLNAPYGMAGGGSGISSSGVGDTSSVSTPGTSGVSTGGFPSSTGLSSVNIKTNADGTPTQTLTWAQMSQAMWPPIEDNDPPPDITPPKASVISDPDDDSG